MKSTTRICIVALLSSVLGLTLAAQAVNPLWTKTYPGLFFYSKAGNDLSLGFRSDDGKSVHTESIDPATGQASNGNDVQVTPAELDYIAPLKFTNLFLDSPFLKSPDRSLVAIPTDTGITVRSTITGALIKTIIKPANGKVVWYLLSNTLLMRSDDKQVSLFPFAEDAEKALPLTGPIRHGCILTRGGSTYLVMEKTIIKLNNATGEKVWETADVDLFKNIFDNHQLTALYDDKGVLWAATSVLEGSSGAFIGTRIYVLNPETGKLLVPAFPAKIYFTEKFISSGEIISNITDMGEGRYLITAYNASLIDTKLGKEIYADGSYGQVSALKNNVFVSFENKGEFQTINLATQKAIKKYKVGARMEAVEQIGINFWLIGAERNKAALLVLNGETFAEIQRFEDQRVNAYDHSPNGAVFVTGSKLSWYKPDTSLVEIDLGPEFGKKNVLKAVLSASGTEVWLLSATSIVHYDLANQTILNTLPWKAESWFGKDIGEITYTVLIATGKNLFVTRTFPETRGMFGWTKKSGPVFLLAFDLIQNQQVWNTTITNDSSMTFDAAGALVAKTETRGNFIAYPYPVK